jgi:ATP-dependent DNA helicase RecG
MSGYKLSADAKVRIKTMCDTNDGFEIAEVDLRLRGPGDLNGTQQSGTLDLKMADISKDSKLLSYCRDLAKDILENDPDLTSEENISLRQTMDAIAKKQMNWGRIS